MDEMAPRTGSDRARRFDARKAGWMLLLAPVVLPIYLASVIVLGWLVLVDALFPHDPRPDRKDKP